MRDKVADPVVLLKRIFDKLAVMMWTVRVLGLLAELCKRDQEHSVL
jgi:hypothetical protein